jgi:hypothetical protein
VGGRQPGALLTELLHRMPAEPDDVVVATLETRGKQELLDVTRVHAGPSPEQHDASLLLRRHAQSVAGDQLPSKRGWHPPELLLVTVVCRSGRVVPTAPDYFWLWAWRYSNHLSNAYDGDVYLVTEHGWTGCMDERAGFEPALRQRPTLRQAHRRPASMP